MDLGQKGQGIRTDHLGPDGLRSPELYVDRKGVLERVINALKRSPVLIEGDAGIGKTCLLSALRYKLGARFAEISGLHLTPEEFLKSVAEQWGVKVGGEGTEGILRRLSEKLDPHIPHLLLVDEVTDLSCLPENERVRLLAVLRSLTGLRKEGERICSVVLAGQKGTFNLIMGLNPLLGQRLEVISLEPLSEEEFKEYAAKYLTYAGIPLSRVTEKALEEIYELGKGNPRKINAIFLKVLEKAGPDTKIDLEFVRIAMGELPEGVKVPSLTLLTEHQRRILRRIWMHEPHGITVPSLARELREKENIPTSRASVSGTCRLLAAYGLLSREKVGRTHRLRVTPYASNLLKEEGAK
ncbi:MAG: AAA family ATPase [Candidatus Hadarchaeales archaeon]